MNDEKYFSQIGQDKFVDDFFKGKRDGIFVDIGAHDGISGSNTAFFEKFRNWKGICVEPGPEEFKKLQEIRTSINLNCCVSNYSGKSEFTYIEGYSNMLSGLSESYIDSHLSRIDNEIKHYGGKVHKLEMSVFTLQEILEQHGVLEIDYCSIDTEGTEYNIVKSIDFEKTKIKLFSIENNYGDDDVKNFLETKGYVLLTKLQWDDIFVRNDI